MAARARFFAVLALALVVSASATPKPPRFESVADAVSKRKTLSTLLSLVTKANLVSALGPDFNGTVFAPSNGAFERLPAEALVKVSGDSALLTKVLTHHVSAVSPAKFTKRGNTITTLSGVNVVLSRKVGIAGPPVLFVRGAANDKPSRVLRKIRAGKAVIYIINTVLLPAAV